MDRKLLFSLFAVCLFSGLVSPTFLPALREQAGALEKEKLGSAVKVSASFYLPPLAAEEKGFWKENGLEVEWVPFAGGPLLMQAVATGDIKIGMHASSAPVEAAERGLPVVMVAELTAGDPFILWVRADSPYRHPRDLKGKRIGVTALGSATHAVGRVMVRTHGVEKDVRFVGAGSSPAQAAGLKVGAFEAIVNPLTAVAIMKVEGIIREIASADDYLPKPWVDYVIFARKDYVRSKPDVVRKMLRATLQSTDFIRKNPRWTIDKMKSFQGFSEEAAKLVYDDVKFTITGKLERKAVENIRKVFIEYGVITEKAPAVDDLFTNEYLPG